MRLIDADALKEELELSKYIVPNDLNRLLNSEINRCIEAIDNAPTVETQIEHFVDLEKLKTDCLNCEKFKRPQGEWLPNYTSQFMNPGKQCSLCGKIVEFSENYCPKCGAYMRGNNNV